jgi:hypothetical protein
MESHDSKACLYAHHMRDFRRPPEIFKYSAEDCEFVQNLTTSEIGWELCPRGLFCPKCHTTVERLYHSEKYKRVYCDRSRCNKSEICAFFHSKVERDLAQKKSKSYKKQMACYLKKNPQIIDVFKEINEELLDYFNAMKSPQLSSHGSD